MEVKGALIEKKEIKIRDGEKAFIKGKGKGGRKSITSTDKIKQ